MSKNKYLFNIILKITIALIIIGLSSIAVYLLSNQIIKINKSFSEKKSLDYLIENREQVNAKIKNDFLEVDPNYQQKINEAIPSVYNVLSFVDAMESLAKKYSFKQNLSFDQPVAVTDISGPMPLTLIKFNLIISEANINNFTDYLNDFEKLPYFSSINSINYLSNDNTGFLNNSSINISGSFYAHQ